MYRTNIGDSRTNGAEIFFEYHAAIGKHLSFSVFTSTALIRSRYQSAKIRTGETNTDITGNKVESVPDLITRNGLTLRSHFASLTFLYSYTAESYADPLNTIIPSANGAVGLVPSYGLLDVNATFKISSKLKIRFNVNNVTDKNYFTKRPSFYPGPGIWPSDGRSGIITFEAKI